LYNVKRRLWSRCRVCETLWHGRKAASKELEGRSGRAIPTVGVYVSDYQDVLPVVALHGVYRGVPQCSADFVVLIGLVFVAVVGKVQQARKSRRWK
jgi:hypothetical protein